MKPEEVNPHNFKQKKILYNKEGFSIAFGEWMGEEHECLAMRWDGDSNNPKGYPKTFGNPVWFIIPQKLTQVFAKAIIEIKEVDKMLNENL